MKTFKLYAFISITLSIFVLQNDVFAQSYCSPGYSTACSSEDYINKFSFHTLSKQNSGCNGNTNNYIHDLSVTTTVERGGAYPFSVQSGQAYPQGFGIWIDFNIDGDFADANEFVYASATASTKMFSGYISIPAFATIGTTRLRVRCNYSSTVSAIDSCSFLTYGETEDYNITIVQPPNCNNPPTAGTATASSTFLCDTIEPIFLTLNGCPNGNGQTYQWEESINGSTWTIIAGATSKAISYTMSTSRYFRCIVTCSGSATSAPVLVSVNPKFNLTFSTTHVTCYGLNNGSITALLTGGTSPYSYHWTSQGSAGIADPSENQIRKKETTALFKDNNGGMHPDTFPNAATISNLYATSYDIVITDSKGCKISATEYVNEPSPVYLTGNSLNASCATSNGAASVSVSGGTVPYTYLWQGGQTNDTITAIPSGLYTVTVTDSNSCVKSLQVGVSDIGAPVLTFTVTNVSCHDGTNGTAHSLPYGGTPPFSYVWTTTPVKTTAKVTGLIAGNYFVTVTDPAGCKAIKDTTIYQPDSLKSGSYKDPASCGLCNGAVYVSPYGGTWPYTYQWYNGSTDYSVGSLCAGNYSVTITDANSCILTETITVSQRATLNAGVTQKNVSCAGACNGLISSIPTGGVSPYVFNWYPAGPVGDTASALCPGTYSLIVTDSEGCTQGFPQKDTVIVTITQPAVLSSTVTSTNNSCFGGTTGSATATVSGGTTPYTYSWNSSPVQTTATAINLAAGNYSCQITDANGCTVSNQTVTITQPATLLTTTTSATNVTCNSACDGSATSSATGGVTPYSYLWMPGSYTINSISALCANSYTLTTTDAAGCVITKIENITQPAVLTLSLSATNASCNALCNGTGNAAVSGGTAPYTYAWFPSNMITANVTGLCAGTHTLVVIDSQNCSATGTISITQPLAIPVTVTTTPTSCGNNSGSATAIVSGAGTIPPISILWTTGATGNTITGLNSGIYRANVTDGNGCFNFEDALITSSNGPVITFTTTAISCFGLSDGDINISVTGGTQPYTYSWSNGSTTQDASGLSYGPYEVSVKDASGCLAVKSIFVNQPAKIGIGYSSINSGCSATNGSATLLVSGGTAPYLYSWSTGATTSAITNVGANYYEAFVTDSKGCKDSLLLAVQDSGGPVVLVDTIAGVSCGGNSGFVMLSPLDSASIQSYLWNTGGTTQNLNNAQAGNYGVIVSDTNGCKSVLITTVTPVLPPLKPICLVTVDTLTNQNIVVWEKPLSTYIAGFNIYRESSQQGIYQKIAYSPYSAVSTYYDSIVDPNIKWARYKITMRDICGIEGPASPEHKTIHLSVQSATADSTFLIWDAYVGFPFAYYHIFRKDSSAGIWDMIDSVPATITTYLDTTFPKTGDTIFYHVDVDRTGGDCIATIKYPQPMATSVKSGKSNSSDRTTTPGTSVSELFDNSWMSLYPNPSNGVFTVSSSKHLISSIRVYNALGELVYSSNTTSKRSEVIITGLPKGIYHLQAVTSGGQVNRKVVISR